MGLPLGGITYEGLPPAMLRNLRRGMPSAAAGVTSMSIPTRPNPLANLQRGMPLLAQPRAYSVTSTPNQPAEGGYPNSRGAGGSGGFRGGFEGDTAGGGLGQHQRIDATPGASSPNANAGMGSLDDFFRANAGNGGNVQAAAFAGEQQAANQEDQSEQGLENAMTSQLPHLAGGGVLGAGQSAVVDDGGGEEAWMDGPTGTVTPLGGDTPRVFTAPDAGVVIPADPTPPRLGAPNPDRAEQRLDEMGQRYMDQPVSMTGEPAFTQAESDDLMRNKGLPPMKYPSRFSEMPDDLDWGEADQQANDDAARVFNLDQENRAAWVDGKEQGDTLSQVRASTPPSPGEVGASPAAPAPAPSYRSQLRALTSTPPHSWENNRYANAVAAVKAVNDFYAAHPEAAAQRSAEAMQGQLAGDGITQFNTPAGPARTMANRYGSGVFATGGMPGVAPSGSDEKGALDLNSLDVHGADFHQDDPLAGTDWGTKSGIAPAALTDHDLAQAIAGQSQQAAAMFPVDDPDAGKMPVAQQMSAWLGEHPAQAFDDPTVGQDFGGGVQSDPAWRQSVGLAPASTGGAGGSGSGGYRDTLKQLMTGDPRVDRNLMRYVRTPQGASMLAEHSLANQKMDHENELWESRSQHSDERADNRNATTLAKQSAADEAHQQREHDFLNAKYGQQALKTGAPVPFEHQWSDGTISTGFAKPDGSVQITNRSKADPETKIHMVDMPATTTIADPNNPGKTKTVPDPTGKPTKVPHYMEHDTSGRPYLVPVPVGAPSATLSPAGLFKPRPKS